MRLRSFTLIEMMMTLALFSIVMLSITTMISNSLNLMDNLVTGNNSTADMILMTKVLDNKLRNSYNITVETNNVLFFKTFDEEQYRLSYVPGAFHLMSLNDSGKIIRSSAFRVNGIEYVIMEVLKAGKRSAVHIKIKYSGQILDKMYITGYRKED